MSRTPPWLRPLGDGVKTVSHLLESWDRGPKDGKKKKFPGRGKGALSALKPDFEN